MSEESVSEIPSSSSIWASMNTWFTPAVFFVLLNVMIGTIAFTSIFANKKQKQNQNHETHNQPKNGGSSSSPSPLPSVLHTLKSTNFYQEDPQNLSIYQQTPDSDSTHLFNHEQNLQETETHFVLDDFKQAQEERVEENGSAAAAAAAQSMDEVYSQLLTGGGSHFSRTKSDTEPSSGEIPVKLPARMRKSASLKSAFGHFEEEKIVEARRPATVRATTEGDEEVDAKADDFINKFKQQLKLQRSDSILRYKDMIGRGSGGGGPSGGGR